MEFFTKFETMHETGDQVDPTGTSDEPFPEYPMFKMGPTKAFIVPRDFVTTTMGLMEELVECAGMVH